MSKHNKEGLVKVQDPISGKCYFYDFIPTGRIKRMRGIPNNRWSRIFRRIGLKRYTLILNMNDDLFDKTMFSITRWNRH